MKIEEKDLLWFFYKRAFKDELLPHPKNLCSYFWNAIWGAVIWFLADLFVFIPVMVFGGLTWATYNAYLVFSPIKASGVCMCLSTLFGVGLFLSAVSGISVSIYRWHKWWKGYKIVQYLSLFVVGFLFIPTALFIGEYLRGSEGVSPSVTFLIGLIIELGIVLFIAVLLGIIYLFFSDKTNLSKNVLAYLRALKDRNCPLVEPPQSFFDAQREREMNVTDS